VLACTAGIAAIAYFGFGESWQSSLIIGFGLSMSSTASMLQLLAERKQLNPQYGRSTFSILLFQDMAVRPALALLTLLAVAALHPSAPPGVLLVLKFLGVLAVVIVGGRYVLRPMLRIVAET
jgi:glutathione-regulated potassium-efflux system protein KefB